MMMMIMIIIFFYQIHLQHRNLFHHQKTILSILKEIQILSQITIYLQEHHHFLMYFFQILSQHLSLVMVIGWQQHQHQHQHLHLLNSMQESIFTYWLLIVQINLWCLYAQEDFANPLLENHLVYLLFLNHFQFIKIENILFVWKIYLIPPPGQLYGVLKP